MSQLLRHRWPRCECSTTGTGSTERSSEATRDSIFLLDGEVTRDLSRVREYGRLLASIGVNAVAINNVNVDRRTAELLTTRHLPAVAELAAALRPFGVRLALSVNFASPVLLGALQAPIPTIPPSPGGGGRPHRTCTPMFRICWDSPSRRARRGSPVHTATGAPRRRAPA